MTLELDRLLEVVAAIAGNVRKEAEESLRIITIAFIAVSLGLTALILCLPMLIRRQSPEPAS